MVRNILVFFIASTVAIACSQNPITGRNQAKLFPESTMQSLAASEYQTFLNSNKVVSGTVNRDAEMVKRVGQRISRAVVNYYTQKGYANLLEGYQWEYNLVENKAVNAWCMPGGKIVVYTGLLPVSQNEAALAVVMGHEVSHAVFNHTNERMSLAAGAELFSLGLSVAMQNKPAETRNAFLTAVGLGAVVGVILPYSRKNELEADRWGLNWTAMAGYNPQEAIGLWERMERASSGAKPPEFLSTHPTEGNRIEQLKKYMPDALKYYKPMGN